MNDNGRCPKCDRGRLRGPVYKRDLEVGVHEWLEWTCNQCGYSTRTACADKESSRA